MLVGGAGFGQRRNFGWAHLKAVKFRLKLVLTSEITPISEMSHDGDTSARTLGDEGRKCHNCTYWLHWLDVVSYMSVSGNVGDWIEVTCDYSSGMCSEGGTDVVIAKCVGAFLNVFNVWVRREMPLTWCVFIQTVLMTVKYIYGPACVPATSDAIIGSLFQGRMESGITLNRSTTIAMSMKGKQNHLYA